MATSFPKPLQRGRVVLSAATFLLGFVVSAAVIHLLISDPFRLHADIRSEKLAILDAWKGGAYAATFGNSHVNNGFDPRTFDAELSPPPPGLSRAPSINLGLEGGSQSEQRLMAREMLRHFSSGGLKQPQPCFVMLELDAGANFLNSYLTHARVINTYDWDTTKFVWEFSGTKYDRVRTAGRDIYALVAMVMHYSNTGMLSSEILKFPLDQEFYSAITSDGRNGLHELWGVVPDLTEAEKTLDPAVPPVPVKQLITPGSYTLINELAAASGNPKPHFVYFIMPVYLDQKSYRVYPETIQTENGIVPILNIGRPDLYPEIYKMKYWYELGHLNGAGAALASRLLADQLNAWNAAHHWDQDCGG